jgi:hypothetical protein
MPSLLEKIPLASVRTRAQFTVNTGETPVTLVKEAGIGPDERSGTFEYRDIVVYDARSIADQLDLDRHGFAFRSYATAVTDFYDDGQVRRIYYPEMERLVKGATGADKVIVFDHTIRVGDSKAQRERKVREPVATVHNDFTVHSAPQRVRDLLPPAEAEERLRKRYGSINVWRPIRGPVERSPLLICEYGAIEEKDLIPAERYYGERVGVVYNVAFNPGQRWYYFPRMERDEVVLLKCYDSLIDGTARWTAHGSFEDPNTPADAAPRESIETRTLYFFE